MISYLIFMFVIFTLGFFIMSTFALFFLFWLFHIIHMFGSVAFPFKFQHWVQSKGSKRRTYVVEIVSILLCAFLPAILAASTSGFQFPGFPPICFTTSEPLMFYTFLLPLTLGSTVTLIIMFTSFWIVRKVVTHVVYCALLWSGYLFFAVNFELCMHDTLIN